MQFPGIDIYTLYRYCGGTTVCIMSSQLCTLSDVFQIKHYTGIKFSILFHNIGGGRHVQSVPITTKIVSLNPAHGAVYSIPLYVIKFVSDLRQVDGCFQVFRFLSPIKLTSEI